MLGENTTGRTLDNRCKSTTTKIRDSPTYHRFGVHSNSRGRLNTLNQQRSQPRSKTGAQQAWAPYRPNKCFCSAIPDRRYDGPNPTHTFVLGAHSRTYIMPRRARPCERKHHKYFLTNAYNLHGMSAVCCTTTPALPLVNTKASTKEQDPPPLPL